MCYNEVGILFSNRSNGIPPSDGASAGGLSPSYAVQHQTDELDLAVFTTGQGGRADASAVMAAGGYVMRNARPVAVQSSNN